MILFKCDVCGCECPEKVVSCQLAFGVKNISTNKIGQKVTMHTTELCEGCFKKLWKCMGYTDWDMATVKDVL